MKISIFQRPVTNTISTETFDWPELYKRLIGPPTVIPNNKPFIKAKFGDYYIRGHSEGKGRNDDLLGDCCLIILDVDKPLNGGSLPTPQEIHEKLLPTNVAYAVHSSATPGRCRIVIPVESYNKMDTDQKTWEAFSLVKELGIEFAFAGESTTRSQPWFFPQTIKLENHQAFGNCDGDFFDVGMCKEDVTIFKPESKPERIKTESTGIKNQAWFIEQVKSGTLHRAAISYAGYLNETTTWPPDQIIDHLTLLVDKYANDELKERWDSWEMKGVVKWYNEQGFESGMVLIKEGKAIV